MNGCYFAGDIYLFTVWNIDSSVFSVYVDFSAKVDSWTTRAVYTVSAVAVQASFRDIDSSFGASSVDS